MFQSQWKLIIDFMVAISTLIYVILIYFQLSRYTKNSSATVMKDFVLDFYRDPFIKDLYYMIEYGKFRYTPEFHESEFEPKLDRMLSYLDVLGLLVKRKIIKIDDIEPLEYEITRIYCNREIKKYLNFLKQWYTIVGVNREPFRGLEFIARKLKICDKNN